VRHPVASSFHSILQLKKSTLTGQFGELRSLALYHYQ